MPESNVQAAAEALKDSLNAITGTISAAVERYESAPTPIFQYAYRKWKDSALRILSADRDTVEQCMVDAKNEGNAKTLVSIAGSNLGLAKKLDSFSFDFAGKEFDKQLNAEVDNIVSAASDLLDAIG